MGLDETPPDSLATDPSHLYWDSYEGVAQANLDGSAVNPSFVNGQNPPPSYPQPFFFPQEIAVTGSSSGDCPPYQPGPVGGGGDDEQSCAEAKAKLMKAKEKLRKAKKAFKQAEQHGTDAVEGHEGEEEGQEGEEEGEEGQEGRQGLRLGGRKTAKGASACDSADDVQREKPTVRPRG